ncbi:MAG TPA: class I adenylate-forming enzyme family protein [Chloroflexota bacterium]|nr:class I adenylate-forming enzyme family protein [Chloroflexota bacterium]
MPVPDLVLHALGTESTADAVDRQASTNGDAEAVVDSRVRLTWRQLAERSDRLALALLELGAERNDVALVQLPNSADLFLVRVACEKAGLVLAAVPPSFRRAELRALIAHLRPTVAITAGVWHDRDYAALLAEAAGEWTFRIVVRGDAAPGSPTLAELSERQPVTSSEYLRRTRFTLFERAQIATTSGSTGTPKCTEVPSYARALTGWSQAQRFGVRAGDTLAAFTPMVAGAAEALVYHMVPRLGGRAVLLEHFDAPVACALLAREEIVGATVVPTMLARLAQEPVHPAQFPQLRFFASHGAPLAPEHARLVEERFGARIVQAYGTSDYGGIAATSIDDPPEVRWGTVGKPLHGTELRVVDDHGDDVPVGTVGRLLVRGPHALGGYYRAGASTRESWRTGYFDLQEYGWQAPDGTLTLVGRARDLIIRGGQNIFPSDVEQVLARHPDVAEVAVIGMPDAELGERVCAFVVPRDGRMPTLASIVHFLRQEGLASYKLPERLEVVERLPLVPTGNKIDKRRLLDYIRQKLAMERSS